MRDSKLSPDDSSAKNNKRLCAERSDGESDTSTEDWFVGVCQPPTKVQRLEQDVEEKVRPNKKIPVLMVTRPYLNLLVKPRFFST